jgi:poly-gamma-glutamate synthesis protein (capsule biosynthesis protein)
MVTSSLSLLAVGDIMLDRGVKTSILKNGGDYNSAFRDIGNINDADILFGNLEGPVSDIGRNVGSKYSFRMVPAVVPALKTQGFDVLSVANNHMGDWTKDAFLDTFSKFRDSNISLVGGGFYNQDAIEPKIIEKNGIKFGFLGFSDVGPSWLKVGTSTPGILLVNDQETPNIIKSAAGKCDVLITSFHFGEEYQGRSNLRQRELARMAIDNGARVVVGHHPHIPQETESYKGGIIMYSLGNFVFDQYFSTSTMSGLAIKISFDGNNISDFKELKTHLNNKYQVSVE